MGITYSLKGCERAIIRPIQTPHPAPTKRPAAARKSVTKRFLAMSPPEKRSAKAAATGIGLGRKSRLTKPELQSNCQPAPNSTSGTARPVKRTAQTNVPLRALGILLSGGERLAAH